MGIVVTHLMWTAHRRAARRPSHQPSGALAVKDLNGTDHLLVLALALSSRHQVRPLRKQQRTWGPVGSEFWASIRAAKHGRGVAPWAVDRWRLYCLRMRQFASWRSHSLQWSEDHRQGSVVA